MERGGIRGGEGFVNALFAPDGRPFNFFRTVWCSKKPNKKWRGVVFEDLTFADVFFESPRVLQEFRKLEGQPMAPQNWY